MRRLLVSLGVVALMVAACSDDESADDFLNKCIKYNDHLTEAIPVSCDEEHVGKVIAVNDADEDCPDPATSQFGMGSKKLCIDADQ